MLAIIVIKRRHIAAGCPLVHSFIFNDFRSFFVLRVVDPSTEVFALSAVIICHTTPSLPVIPFASLTVKAQISLT